VKKDEYVRIVGVNGDYRYGYIAQVQERGEVLVISLLDEGESKIAFDRAADALRGEAPVDYVAILTPNEKTLIPLIAENYDTKVIADMMGISTITVRAQLRTLRLKLQLDNRDQLVSFCGGLVPNIKEQNRVDDEIEAMK